MNHPARALAVALVAICATTAASPAPSAPVTWQKYLPDQNTIDLQGAYPADFCNALFRDTEHLNFTLSPEIIADHRVITIRLTAPTPKIHAAGLAYLHTLGYLVKDSDGVLSVETIPAPIEPKPVEPKRRTEIYAPKFRTATYLMGQLRTIAPLAKFGGDTGALSAPPEFTKGEAGAQMASAAPTSAAGKFDRTADVLLYNSTEAEMQVIAETLPLLDKPEGELIVRATVYEVTTTKNDASAVALAASILSSKIGLAFNPTTILTNALTIQSTGGGNKAVISALNEDTRFHVLSSPVAHARSGTTASFTSGQEVPILSSVSYSGNSTTPVQSVSYRSAGVIFKVTPTKRESIIALDVHQELSNFISTTTGVNSSPTLNKREMDSSLSVTKGAIVLLGGLTEDTHSRDEAGLSFLPKWLDSKSANDGHSEIILMLQVDEDDNGRIGPALHMSSGQ
jgi:hypothetical protein